MRGSMVKIKDMEVVIIRVESNLRQDNGASLWCKQLLFFHHVNDFRNEFLHMMLQNLKLFVK
jgi:hypothetical protein